MSRTRILHCLAAVATGGVERRRLLLARLLDPERYEQRILACEALGPLRAELESLGIDVLNLDGTVFSPRVVARVMGEARAWRPDIVHGAVFEGSSTAVVAGLACGARIVVEETSFAIHRSYRGRAFFRALAGVADACVAVSPTVGEHLRRTSGIPADKIVVLKNGMFAPLTLQPQELAALRQRHGIPSDAFVVGTVARLFDYIKRVSDLIHAVSLLAPEHPELHLLVVGDGPDRRMLEQLARSLGVEQRVSFVGHHVEIGGFYRLMDVFALVSTQEGMPLSLIEAMLAGLPSVATPVGGINDLLTEQTGISVPTLSPAAIAAALRRLHQDPALRSAQGGAAKARAQHEFGAERYARDVDVFYSKLLASPARLHQSWRRPRPVDPRASSGNSRA